MLFAPALGMALATFLGNGRPVGASEVDLCAEVVEIAEDPAPLAMEELAIDDLGDGHRDCAPADLLPDASCEDPPSTIWPAAVTACDTPLFKLRKSPHRGPGLAMPSPGRRPLKGVAASDLGSFRASSGHSAPLPEKDVSFSRDPALAPLALCTGPEIVRISFERGALPALPAGYGRRLERPPEA